MDAEDFAVDDCAENEEIEDLTAGFPDRSIAIFLLTFFVETVDLSNLTGFMITSDESDAVRIAGRLSQLRAA